MQTESGSFLHDWQHSLKIKYCVRLAALLCILFSLLLSVFPVSAVTSQPDSTPTITKIHVNRNMANTDDIFIYGEYNIPYATPPTINAGFNFIFRLMSADGTTELGNITPYVYHTGGYGKGIVSFYFLDGTLTWGTAYIIRIQENPTSDFASPTYWDITIPGTAYTSLTGSADNKVELATNLYNIGQDLETDYGKTFFQSSGGNMVLSADGETYFRGAISGLQAMAPTLFVVQDVPLSTTARAWTTTQFDTYRDRFNGTWVGAGMTATGTQFGMNASMVLALIAIVPLCIGMIIFASLKFKRAEPGYVAASLIMIMGVLMGWLPTALFASIYQFFGIYIGFIIFYSRG